MFLKPPKSIPTSATDVRSGVEEPDMEEPDILRGAGRPSRQEHAMVLRGASHAAIACDAAAREK